MPRTRSLAWSELRIGVLTISAIVIAAVLIFSLTGTRGFFWQRYPLKSTLPYCALQGVLEARWPSLFPLATLTFWKTL